MLRLKALRLLQSIKTVSVTILFMSLLTIAFTSCSGSNADEPDNEKVNPQNQRLSGTKWTTRNWDYDVADDYKWIYAFTEVYSLYFYSDSEGCAYYSRKTIDSDDGSSRETNVCFFKYNVDADGVELDPITDQIPEMSTYYELSGDQIIIPMRLHKRA